MSDNEKVVENEFKNDLVHDKASAGPGELLAKARQEKMLSIQDVAQYLHLSKDVIQGLEENDFSHLSALTFAKGYLRAYAKYLNLDADEILKRFYALGLVEPEKVTTQRVVVKEFKISEGPIRWIGYVVAITLAALVMLWWYNHSNTQDEMNSKAAMTSLQTMQHEVNENPPKVITTPDDVNSDSAADATFQEATDSLEAPQNVNIPVSVDGTSANTVANNMNVDTSANRQDLSTADEQDDAKKVQKKTHKKHHLFSGWHNPDM